MRETLIPFRNKECGCCKRYLSIDHYNKDPTRIDGRANWCVDCREEYYHRNYKTARGRILRIRRNALARSRRKGIAFDLNIDDLIKLYGDGICEVTKGPFNLERWKGGHARWNAPSLDRIDTKGGYTIDNVRFVMNAVNVGRGEWGDDLYYRICRAVVENM